MPSASRYAFVCFVGLEAVEAQPVLARVDADSSQPKFRRRPHDADGDFASIQGEQLLHPRDRDREKRLKISW
jgi:hypothetical protein